MATLPFVVTALSPSFTLFIIYLWQARFRPWAIITVSYTNVYIDSTGRIKYTRLQSEPNSGHSNSSYSYHITHRLLGHNATITAAHLTPSHIPSRGARWHLGNATIRAWCEWSHLVSTVNLLLAWKGPYQRSPVTLWRKTFRKWNSEFYIFAGSAPNVRTETAMAFYRFLYVTDYARMLLTNTFTQT
jgi:hypothetical protein